MPTISRHLPAGFAYRRGLTAPPLIRLETNSRKGNNIYPFECYHRLRLVEQRNEKSCSQALYTWQMENILKQNSS
jgi:hypothetical protein